ncbi:hypothetical protein FSARC_14958 [Fusarium sarcochroum]|uniref:Extracellular membrane protein CFEM domain-containing protein n=1 Tax=Fusarium sarcochroum TaxID=1208366 RepID=A0A8H4SPM8_9HYPO|nr:hypothetical protein FSARC_14958 [Fusarium sarcochroum]
MTLELNASFQKQCLSETITAVGCEDADLLCICTAISPQSELLACIQTACNTESAMSMVPNTHVSLTSFAKIFAVASHSLLSLCNVPSRDKSADYKTLCITLVVVSSFLVVQRFAFKIYAKLDLGPDDWLALAATVLNLVSAFLILYGLLANGLGQDIWGLPRSNITRYGIYLYTTAILYFVEVALLKLSMLFFYLRIFPTSYSRWCIWSTIIFNSVFTVVFNIVIAFCQCKPIDYFWNRWNGQDQGKCLNINAIAWSNSAINIALDIWMLSIPLWHLHYLNLSLKKKMEVGLMFSFGGL